MKYEVQDRIYVTCLYNCGEVRVLSMLFDTGAVRTVVCSDSLEGVLKFALLVDIKNSEQLQESLSYYLK